uniref:Uncharacterized protein n=1 Tax=Fagus sylvatica TaxID=28930 RepID=A0A2N9GG13_FAGSY
MPTFCQSSKPKASNFALRAQGKQSPVVYGGPVVYRGRKQELTTLGHQIKPKPQAGPLNPKYMSAAVMRHYYRKGAGPPLCPAVTIDTIKKRSTATPDVSRNEKGDKTRAEEAEEAAMAAEAATTQGATTTIAQHSGGHCSPSIWNLGRTVWR